MRLDEYQIANALIDTRLVMTSRLGFTDGEMWRLRLLLLPESRRSGCDT
jgi:hypothetical protein